MFIKVPVAIWRRHTMEQTSREAAGDTHLVGGTTVQPDAQSQQLEPGPGPIAQVRFTLM